VVREGFFVMDAAATEIYAQGDALSLPDALPI